MAGQGIHAQGRNESGQPVCRAEPEAVREQVKRVVSDPLFCNSKRYSGLLKFIADRSLDGRLGDLKERIIGIEVFGRSPDYDTSNDATVRVAANEVRKRLALYYKEPGREQELRIDVPSGSYVAEFRVPELAPPAPRTPPPQETGIESQPPAEPPQKGSLRSAVAALGERRLRYLKAAAAVVVLGLAAWGIP